MAVIEAIQTTYLESDVNQVNFTSIPSTYEHLQLRCQMKSNRNSDVDGFRMYFGTSGTLDTAANYGYHWMRGYGSTAAAGRLISTYLNWQHCVAAKNGLTDATSFGTAIVDIFGYTDNKNTICTCTMGANAVWESVSFESGFWDNTGVVDTIQLLLVNGPNFMRGSEFTLYGITG